MVSAVLSVCFLAGVVLVAYGAWLAWAPAGFIVAGLALMLIAILYARSSWVSSTG